ncbi:MAG: inositol monophosphatase family protein, partial [Thiobacillaceae bacterium]
CGLGKAKRTDSMKIFGIGLSKTGTSSLAHALEILGYRVKDYPGIERYVPGDPSCIDPALLEHYDALTDTPIPSFYRELDRAYPGSKFILTVRERAGWLKSCQKQFTEKLAAKQNEAHNRLFLDLYGTTVFDTEKFSAGYERFVAGVLEYFRDRPRDLLVMDITGGDGWEKLCPFLGKTVPDQPFPKANVTRIRWMNLHALEAAIRQACAPLHRAERALLPLSEVGWPPFLKTLPARMLLRLGGDPLQARSAVMGEVRVRLDATLRALIPDIPVVMRLQDEPPPALGRTVNHFWLVDPMDGEAAFAVPGLECSVNVALIEDGRPVAGVTYAPRSGLAVSAMIGKGVYLTRAHQPPERLDGLAQVPRLPASWAERSSSLALSLCHALFSEPDNAPVWPDVAQWQTAAPDAVARLLGRRLIVEGGAEPAYGRGDWRITRLQLR